MPPRFSRPRLIDAEDKQYRAFIEQIMLGKDNQRPTRLPYARELFGGEAEAALRQWLGQQRALSERRIVEYHEHRGRSSIKKYRELDAVVLVDNRTVEVYEIKASRKAGSLRRASQQLRDTRNILRMLFSRVSATILLVDTGIPKNEADVAALMQELAERSDTGEAPPYPPPTLGEVLASLPHVHAINSLDEQTFDADAVSLMHFSVDDIIAIAGAENLHLDWDEDEIEDDVPEEAAPEPPRYAYSTDEAQPDEEDESPLAAALRKAMQGRQ
ncbi:MAG TPA: hypothetical protein VFT66_01185 [Roseiflexaceae bacterium]|nr:hypothetical protein [Roseiflexaceae bacterium]